jgi:hypothetical protein
MGNTQVSKYNNSTRIINYGSKNSTTVGPATGGSQSAVNAPKVDSDLMYGNPLTYAYTQAGSVLMLNNSVAYVFNSDLMTRAERLRKINGIVRSYNKCLLKELPALDAYGFVIRTCYHGTNWDNAKKTMYENRWVGTEDAFQSAAEDVKVTLKAYATLMSTWSQVKSVVPLNHPSDALGIMLPKLLSDEKPLTFFAGIEEAERRPAHLALLAGKLINGINAQTTVGDDETIVVDKDNPLSAGGSDVYSTSQTWLPTSCNDTDNVEEQYEQDAKMRVAKEGSAELLMLEDKKPITDIPVNNAEKRVETRMTLDDTGWLDKSPFLIAGGDWGTAQIDFSTSPPTRMTHIGDFTGVAVPDVYFLKYGNPGESVANGAPADQRIKTMMRWLPTASLGTVTIETLPIRKTIFNSTAATYAKREMRGMFLWMLT